MTTPQTNGSHYFEALVHRNWVTWLWAVMGALGLNLALFIIMPYLQHPARNKPAPYEMASQIQVIRLKQPDTPVKRKPQPPPEKPSEPQKHKPRSAHPPRATLRLPFAINPRLPAAPNSLSLPPLPPATFDTAGLDDAFSMGDLDNPLIELVRIPPIYPMRAKRRRIEGWVRVRFIVNEDGSVGKVTVLESHPVGVFEKSAIQCVSGWRFKPGTVEGMAVKVRAKTILVFNMK